MTPIPTGRSGNLPNRGFSLIEMLITVLIVGVLLAIVVPTYQQYINKARRTEALAQLQASAQFLQRLLDTNNGAYQVGGAAPQLPAELTTSPPNATGSKVNYNIIVSTPTPNTFTLSAVRRGAMSSDACGDFVLDQRGRLSQQNASKTLQECTR
jgi:type IV pilus assembly protein PilE